MILSHWDTYEDMIYKEHEFSFIPSTSNKEDARIGDTHFAVAGTQRQRKNKKAMTARIDLSILCVRHPPRSARDRHKGMPVFVVPWITRSPGVQAELGTNISEPLRVMLLPWGGAEASICIPARMLWPPSWGNFIYIQGLGPGCGAGSRGLMNTFA